MDDSEKMTLAEAIKDLSVEEQAKVVASTVSGSVIDDSVTGVRVGLLMTQLVIGEPEVLDTLLGRAIRKMVKPFSAEEMQATAESLHEVAEQFRNRSEELPEHVKSCSPEAMELVSELLDRCVAKAAANATILKLKEALRRQPMPMPPRMDDPQDPQGGDQTV